MAIRCKFFKECNGYAITRVPYSNIPLCKYHFLKYINDRVWKTIKQEGLIDFNNPKEKLIIALSGGKDSQTLLTILSRILKNKIPMEGLYIEVGISPEDYSKKSLDIIRKTTEHLKIPLNVIDIKDEMGFNMDDIHELGLKTNEYRTRNGLRFRGECSYCGIIKRYYLNKFAYENGFTKVATGHNLTDEATTLFSNFLNIDIDLMSRAGPSTITNVNKLVTRIKPLFYVYESEIMLYTLYANIEHVSTQCEYAQESPMIKLKKSMLKIEKFRRGTMRNMVQDFQKELRKILLEKREKEKNIENYCINCNMPTYIYSKSCSFCNTRTRLGEQIAQIKDQSQNTIERNNIK